MFKTTEIINKALYYPLTDDGTLSTGGIVDNVEENNLNILGDDISTESQDVLFGAIGDAAAVCCKGNEPCLDDSANNCQYNMCSRNMAPAMDISCREDLSCGFDRPLDVQSGVVLTYIGVTLYGFQSGNTSNQYQIDWLSAYTGDWKKVQIGVKSGTTYNKFTSASTKISLTQSGNTNYWYTYYTTNVADITLATSASYSTVSNVGYSIPGHHTGSCNLIQRTMTAADASTVISRFNLNHYSQTLSAMCNVIQIENSTSYVGNYNTTKFGGVKYTFYNETQGVVVSAMSNTVYTGTTTGIVAPQFIIHCPYQSFYVERSRPGLIFPTKEKITLTRVNGITMLYFDQFLSNNIIRDYKVATLSDFKEMYPSASYTSLINSTDDSICLVGALSKVTSVYPFGCFMSGDCYSQKVWLASDFLGMSGTTYGWALVGSSFNANTYITSKKTISLIPY
jgi:hypothetical protein